MRKLGLIGGMSWESTLLYYRLINEYTRDARGGLHSAPCVVHSLDFAPIAAWQQAGAWDECGEQLATMAVELENIGAEAIVLCTNTMHKVADVVQGAVDIPLLHIVDATGDRLQAAGLKKVLLLGTAYTMSDPFYRDYLHEKFGIEALVPHDADQALVHKVIYEELCLGVRNPVSRDAYLAIIERAHKAGAEGVILGCTEITLLIQQAQVALPLFDSTDLHARHAVAWALQSINKLS